MRFPFRRIPLLIARLAQLCATLFLLVPAGRGEPVDSAVEYRIKAAYLYNFTKFIDWPPSAFAAPGAPFVIGVVDPVGDAALVIEKSLRGKTAPGGREIEVRRFTGIGEATADCHQLFITRAAGVDPRQAGEVLGSEPVLVVGETEGFAERGGVIGFVVSNDGVRCDVNLAGAQRAGVKLSGRLASVARLVRETGRK